MSGARRRRRAAQAALQQTQMQRTPAVPGAPRLGAPKNLTPLLESRGLTSSPHRSLEHGLPIMGTLSDAETLRQIQQCLADERAAWAALMADNQRGYGQPVGGVVAYRRAVSLTAAGVDIGCGVTAVRLDLTGADLGVDRTRLGQTRFPAWEQTMDHLARQIHFGVGVDANLAPDHPVFDDPRWGVDPMIAELKALGRRQLGSVGGGNHFVDVTLDGADRVWVVMHFGSRGMGNKTAVRYTNLAQGREAQARPPKEDTMAPPVVLDLGTALGDDYFTAMELACDYARAGRAAVGDQVARLLGTRVVETVGDNHNDSRREVHDVGFGPEELIVGRKGATPIGPGLRGVVGGSMGEDLVIIEGRPGVESDSLLGSAMHGAGRVLSRTQAAGKKDWKTNTRSGGLITEAMMDAWLAPRGIVRRGGDVDESPHAYRRLPAVVAAHAESLTVVETLRPIGVMMAGQGDVDPYKD